MTKLNQIETAMSARALRAVATRLENNIKATRSKNEKSALREQLAGVLERLEQVSAPLSAKAEQQLSDRLSAIALRASISRIDNKLPGTRGKVRAELLAKRAEIETKLAAYNIA